MIDRVGLDRSLYMVPLRAQHLSLGKSRKGMAGSVANLMVIGTRILHHEQRLGTNSKNLNIHSFEKLCRAPDKIHSTP